MTLVAMALQGGLEGGGGRVFGRNVVLPWVAAPLVSTGHILGCEVLGLRPNPARGVMVVMMAEVVAVSAKLGLCGGVMHSEERDTRSLGDSRVSGCRLSESQESEVGVSGRGLGDLWTQELMHTSASAASRSWYCSVVEQDFSLSFLFLSIITSQISMRLV